MLISLWIYEFLYELEKNSKTLAAFSIDIQILSSTTMWGGGYGFELWKKSLAEMRGKTVYSNRPLWLEPCSIS